MLGKVKLALRVTTNAFDEEILDLVSDAMADLNVVGIQGEESDRLIRRAVITYCRMHFGSPENYDDLKSAYDEQKAQLQMATGYGLPEDT